MTGDHVLRVRASSLSEVILVRSVSALSSSVEVILQALGAVPDQRVHVGHEVVVVLPTKSLPTFVSAVPSLMAVIADLSPADGVPSWPSALCVSALSTIEIGNDIV